MQLIKIGKDIHNDVVINDGYVSRFHCQIMNDGAGHFTIADTGSTNGTFVNNMRIYGETTLRPTDVVRIGNTTLPWQSYVSGGNNGGGSNGGGNISGGSYNPPTNSGGIAMGITALSCGVVGLFSGFPFIFGVLAIIFGAISMHRKERLKGMGIAGFVLGIIETLVGIIILISFGNIFLYFL